LFLLFLLLGVMAGFWNLMKAVNAEVADVRREAEARDEDRDSQV
jgi:F0F1-type ATP synthase assembly protein I